MAYGETRKFDLGYAEKIFVVTKKKKIRKAGNLKDDLVPG